MSFRVLPNASRRIGMVIATGALLVASGVPAYADDPQAPPPFRLSGFAAEGRGHGQVTVPISGAAVVGAATWIAGFLPGLVRANAIAPGPYEAAGDPSVAAGPNNVFWYANLAFNRTDNANSVAVSRSENGGATWSTSFVLQTSAADGGRVFNDK